MPSQSPLTPPQPPRRPTVLRAHGDERVDDWFWLRERDNPEVISHLEAENAFTAAMTAHTSALQESLFKEMVSRIQETDLSVPVRKGPWLYYSRTEEGRQYAIHCRRPAGGPLLVDAGVVAPDEQVLLDENETAGESDYFALGGFAVSPDHRWLAYATDVTGAERYTLRFRDLHAKEDRAEVVEDTYYGLAWANDNATIFFTRPDETMRPHQLWRHTLGSTEDTCVYEEKDERFYLGVSRTKDDTFVLLDLESKTTTETRALPADQPDGTFGIIEPRRQDVEYSLTHYGDTFYMVTNDGAENFRLVGVPDRDYRRGNWRDVLPYDERVRTEGVDVMGGHLVLYERSEGNPRIRVLRLADGDMHTIDQPEAVSTVWGGPNPEIDSTILRYEYTSMVTPRSVYDYDLVTRERTLLKRQAVLGDFDPSQYTTERSWAAGED
ncbi:MAG: oligopeptidase B, partial [Acidimicrobiales bacterium]